LNGCKFQSVEEAKEATIVELKEVTGRGPQEYI
jgi:hypothetical protein